MRQRTNQQRMALAGLPPFSGCTGRELALIDSLATSMRVPAGTLLTRQGARGRQCFVIEDGIVDVRTDEDGSIAECGRGDWVGELSLLQGTLRSATTTTSTETDLLVFDPGAFAALVTEVQWSADHVRLVATQRRAALTGAAQRATTASRRDAVPVLRLA
jgi:CRP/FNR family transcriptional regulator, cyclic AMP receptor protein